MFTRNDTEIVTIVITNMSHRKLKFFTIKNDVDLSLF